jgi:hypothetical protein
VAPAGEREEVQVMIAEHDDRVVAERTDVA